jgi:hypothetical protein
MSWSDMYIKEPNVQAEKEKWSYFYAHDAKKKVGGGEGEDIGSHTGD